MGWTDRFGGWLPRSFRAWLASRIVYAGFDQPVEIWAGSRLMVLAMYTLLAAAGGYILTTPEVWGAGAAAAGTVATIVALFYLNLYYRILNRTRQLEKILPDFLLLIAANLRAGMTPFGGFIKAIRPEFGDLYEEAKTASARVGGKRSLREALIYLTGRFDSPIFERSMRLFTKGIRSGSQLARLLTTNAEEIRRIQDLREELVSTTRSYMIFIGFVVVIVMPFLLSVSAFFLKVFVGIQSQVQGDTGQLAVAIPLLGGEIGIRPEDVVQISTAALVITSFLASMLMGVIRAGRWVYGVRYFPFIAIASLIFMFLADKLVGQLIPVG